MPASFLVWLLISIAFPSPSVDGVKIVTRQVTGGLADTRTEYVTADRLRSEWQATPDHSGYTMASIIQGGERERVFVLDLLAHEYVTYETDSRGAALGVKSPSTEDSGGRLQIWIDSTDTGERRDFFGHVARHIITKEKRIASPDACGGNSESQTDGWYVDMSIMPEWRQPKKRLGGVVVTSVLTAGNCVNKFDKIEVHRTGVEPGFPVKLSTTLQNEVKDHDHASKSIVSTWGSEVVELSTGPLDPKLFEVPPDFRRVERLKTFASATPRQSSGWDWLREKLQEIFR
jgi:hypothetical protein